jgi:hypothetical protein
MALVKSGFWQTTYWPSRSWQEDYWLEYALDVATKIEEAVYSAMIGNINLTALVSTKMYPVKIPQNIVLPAISYHKTTDISERAMGTNMSIKTSYFQFNCWSAEYDNVRTIATALRGVFIRWRGLYSGITIYDSLREIEYEEFYPEEKRYSVTQEYRIFHN